MNKIFAIVLSVLLLGFTTVGCLIGADVIKLGTVEEKAPVEETIDVTQTDEYKALEAQKNAVIAEKETLTAQLETKNTKIAELQAEVTANAITIAELQNSATANASKIAELQTKNAELETEITELENEKTTMQATIDALNNQVASLQARLEQVEYVNKTIDDMTITYSGRSYLFTRMDFVGFTIDTSSCYSGSDFIENIESISQSFWGFQVLDNYLVENSRQGNGICFSVYDFAIYDGLTDKVLHVLDTSGNELVLDETYAYYLRDVQIDYVLYTVEELEDTDYATIENALKSIEITLKFDFVI